MQALTKYKRKLAMRWRDKGLLLLINENGRCLAIVLHWLLFFYSISTTAIGVITLCLKMSYVYVTAIFFLNL